MELEDFNYGLPKKLIAQKPVRPRDRSRLLIIETGKTGFKHGKFHEIEKFLRPGDVLVLNDSRVFPARLYGQKSTGGKTEILLLREIDDGRWQALIKNLKETSIKKGKILILPPPPAAESKTGSGLTASISRNLGNGIWLVKFNLRGEKLKRTIYQCGRTPVPPYIKRLSNLKEYQTVYARHPGSAAAPTAGFHFTRRLLNRLKKKKIGITFVTLHAGLGTFQPIKTADVKEHKMHSEWAKIRPETARMINQAKKEGRRIIAVGTTSIRVLESFGDKSGRLKTGKKEVDLFILPGYKFKMTDGLITNFHLPKTTLLLLVSAFLGFKEQKQRRGRQKLFRAYREAIRRKYRFYSFGDAMMII